jgi:NRAMP (natural resistance-associated macrophage protein)-like metal ion transporter
LATTDYPGADQAKRPDGARLADVLGPGLITGASDDDPSGIATYAQAGAAFGFALSWTLLLTYPLMCAIQMISAEIGRVTGKGIAANMRRLYPPYLLYVMVGLLVLANVINIGADLGAMGAALRLMLPGPQTPYVAGFAALIVVLEVFMKYASYASVLRWLTLSLFAYVATVFVVGVPWGTVAFHLVVPHIKWTGAYFTIVVAVFGTTISPYLFFWQASEEVEEVKDDPTARPILDAPADGPRQLKRIRLDTIVGMALSNLVALFIVLTTAATLNAHGVTNVATSADAAKALRPIAGEFAFAVFALGIVGTGLLAVPVLAGSAAYALAETLGWRAGLAERPGRAPAFYGAITAAVVVGALLNVSPLDPIKALIFSAVVNGVAAVPIMIMIMLMASQRRIMGEFALHPWLKTLGWLATVVMAAAAAGMFATWNA